jgi:sulfonate transport system substrate-binding protein
MSTTVTETDELWYARCPVPTASGIALDLGWLNAEFARDGIRLSSVRDADLHSIRQAHFHHRLPGLFREGGNIPAIWAKSTGVHTSVVALTWVDEFQAILTRADDGIRSIGDLRGRRIAVPRQDGERVDFARAMALHGIVSALGLAGLGVPDVELIDVASEQTDLRNAVANRRFHAAEVEAVLDGRADAVYVKGAVGVGVVRERGLHVLVDVGAHPDPLVRVNNGNPRPVTVDRETAEQRPDLVARYLVNLIRAADWARDHADQVTAIVAKEVGRPEEDVRAGYGRGLPRSFALDLSPERQAALAAQAAFLRQWGFLAADVDVPGWIDARPLALARGLV